MYVHYLLKFFVNEMRKGICVFAYSYNLSPVSFALDLVSFHIGILYNPWFNADSVSFSLSQSL